MDIVTLVAHLRILAEYYTNMNMNRQNSIILNTVGYQKWHETHHVLLASVLIGLLLVIR